jgi:molybdate transport system regulatory protein
MELSARNQVVGTVESVKEGAVMAEVVVKMDGNPEVVSAITMDSLKRLGIAPGAKVYVVIKSTDVMIGKAD